MTGAGRGAGAEVRTASGRSAPAAGRRTGLEVAFAAAEAAPFSGSGAVAETAGLLPGELQRLGHRVTVFMPGYAGIDRSVHKLVDLKRSVEIPIADRAEVAHFERASRDGADYLFVRNDTFFDRVGIYGDRSGDFVDNAARFSFFARAVLAYLAGTGIAVDVLHALDWPAALLPVYLDAHYRRRRPFHGSLVVQTFHDPAAQGRFEVSQFHDLDLPRALLSSGGLELLGKMSFLKGGLLHADVITTVSRRYADEVQREEQGHGLESLLRRRRSRLVGILNGVRLGEWDPATDRYLKSNFGPDDLVGKRSCKIDLQGELELTPDVEVPIVAVGTQLVDEKGTDLVVEAFPQLLKLDLQMVVAGGGERRYVEFFRDAARRHPGRVGVRIGGHELTLHKLLAGADLFLVPSRAEALGHDAVRAMRFGTVPVARATGALDDAVEEFDPATGSGSGFKFAEASAPAAVEKLRRALELHRGQPESWRRLMRNAMTRDFSWAATARAYGRLYADGLARGRPVGRGPVSRKGARRS